MLDCKYTSEDKAQKFVENVIELGLNVVIVQCTFTNCSQLDHPFTQRFREVAEGNGAGMAVIAFGAGGGEWAQFLSEKPQVFGLAYGDLNKGSVTPQSWVEGMVHSYRFIKKNFLKEEISDVSEEICEEIRETIDIVVYYHEDDGKIIKVEDWKVKGEHKDVYVASDYVEK